MPFLLQHHVTGPDLINIDGLLKAERFPPLCCLSSMTGDTDRYTEINGLMLYFIN